MLLGLGDLFLPVEVLWFFWSDFFCWECMDLLGNNVCFFFREFLLQSRFSKENAYSVSSFDCDNTCVDPPADASGELRFINLGGASLVNQAENNLV